MKRRVIDLTGKRKLTFRHRKLPSRLYFLPLLTRTLFNLQPTVLQSWYLLRPEGWFHYAIDPILVGLQGFVSWLWIDFIWHVSHPPFPSISNPTNQHRIILLSQAADPVGLMGHPVLPKTSSNRQPTVVHQSMALSLSLSLVFEHGNPGTIPWRSQMICLSVLDRTWRAS